MVAISGSYFSYDLGTGTTGSQGFGSITYTDVPEPLTVLGSMTAIGLGAGLERKLEQKKLNKNS